LNNYTICDLCKTEEADCCKFAKEYECSSPKDCRTFTLKSMCPSCPSEEKCKKLYVGTEFYLSQGICSGYRNLKGYYLWF
jgi:hypothetical protein